MPDDRLARHAAGELEQGLAYSTVYAFLRELPLDEEPQRWLRRHPQLRGRIALPYATRSMVSEIGSLLAARIPRFLDDFQPWGQAGP